MIRCVAIDNEPLALKQIANYFIKTRFLELTEELEIAYKFANYRVQAS